MKRFFRISDKIPEKALVLLLVLFSSWVLKSQPPEFFQLDLGHAEQCVHSHGLKSKKTYITLTLCFADLCLLLKKMLDSFSRNTSSVAFLFSVCTFENNLFQQNSAVAVFRLRIFKTILQISVTYSLHLTLWTVKNSPFVQESLNSWCYPFPQHISFPLYLKSNN